MIELPTVRTTRTRYPDQVKALAYEVYAHRANGDMPETLRIMAELCDPPVSEKTVYQWRADHQWDRRMEEERRNLSPVLWETYFGGLAVAAPESVAYLRSVVTNPDASDRDRIAASRVILSQVVAHIGQLEALMPKPQSEDSKLADLSTEELLALASAAAEGE